MNRTDRPIGELLRDLVQQLGNMVRDEAHLARAEMGEKWDQVLAAGGLFAAALAFGVGAIVILLMSAVAALALVVSTWLASLIVGGVALVIALLLAARAQSNLRPENLKPARTIGSVRADTQLAKEKVR